MRTAWGDVRPLDRVRTIKVKLGVLVAASAVACSAVMLVGLLELGIYPEYSLPAAVLLSLAVTQVLAHGMTKPLREMTAAARAMARGDYRLRVRATSRDEVGQLAQAFNTMAADLEAVDAQRRAFVANVSHELRTPVTALRAVLENLADGLVQPDPRTLGTALEQAERLGRLVEDLLDLSRLEAGATVLEREVIAVADVLDPAVRGARFAVDAGNHSVRFEVAVLPADLTVWADPARLHQVLANLLDNAARHSPPGAVVSIRASPTADGTRIEVHDQGPGIDAADRERVFERFERGVAAGSDGTSDGGTGLGLAIARWVVELHGGTIRALAPSEGDLDVSGTRPAPAGCRIRVDLLAPARHRTTSPTTRARTA